MSQSESDKLVLTMDPKKLKNKDKICAAVEGLDQRFPGLSIVFVSQNPGGLEFAINFFGYAPDPDWEKIQKFLETELAEKIDLIKLEIEDAFVATWCRLFRTAGLAFSSGLSYDFHERSMLAREFRRK